MRIKSHKYTVVGKHDDESSLVLDSQRCKIRYTARSADHIMQQRFDPAHNISIREVNSLFKKSIIAQLPIGHGRSVAVGKHNGKIYELYFKRTQTLIDVISCFISSEIDFIKLYQEYEQNSKTPKGLR